ncbi:MAG: hypothetical protein WCQ00_00265 [bacterium]
MKTKLLTVVVTMVSLVFTNCAMPSGTPEQRARQTEANAKMGNAVGMAALGVAAAAVGGAVLNNSMNRPTVPYGGYGRRGYYRGHYVEPYYNPYANPFGW